MAAVSSQPQAPVKDVEGGTSYTPIPAGPHHSSSSRGSKKLLAGILLSSFLLLSLVLLIFSQRSCPQVAESLDDSSSNSSGDLSPVRPLTGPPSRGESHGVSEKAFPLVGGGGVPYSWSNVMLSWQRTAYHFQPEKNWMNDPNGPLLYRGWYHLFYQYNQESAVWGNISWGHAVSRDLIHWLHLPHAMVPDRWYDANGVWTGSATTLPDGRIVMLYTGNTHDVGQVQCLAYPANQSDPLLLQWVKVASNPVMVPPPGIDSGVFRDPTTAWLSPGGDKWRITIGSKINETGVALVYETTDFLKYELLDGYLHEAQGTGMWECVDFFPVSSTEESGLDTSANGAGIKHVMKVSLDKERRDIYALGTYDPFKNKWTPDDPELDVGVGLRYDYGEFYASKSFYDQGKRRRISIGWIRETDSEDLDVLKGWASVQSIPRTISFDQKTGGNILQWPVEEVESLRMDSVEVDVKLQPGSIGPIEVDSASQLDIVASFEVDKEAFDASAEADIGYDCHTSGGGANRGMLGPFGIVVLADQTLAELTPIYFYVAKGPNGKAQTHFCADELRSSEAPNVNKVVYGSKVPVLDDEKLIVRSLVDHSVVESFAQGGRTVITSRVYPTKAIGGAARVFLFNNATAASVAASVKIWKMGSADVHPFPLDQL